MAKQRQWQRLDWQDPFLLDRQLTDEQRMVRDTARQYAAERLLPRVRDAFRREETDLAIFREMGELGLLGSTIDGYGCPGVDYISYGLVAREVERATRRKAKARAKAEEAARRAAELGASVDKGEKKSEETEGEGEANEEGS